jgi:integrase
MGYYNVEPLRTPEEISQFKSALHDLGGYRNKFLFTLGINTGLRISDLVKLKVGDIFGKPYTDLLEKKTQKKRRLHLIAIQGDIVEYCVGKHPEDFLFPSKKTDSHISTTQAYRILVAAGEWIGRKDIGTHTMRKTFGYHYYKRTKDVYTLMEIFGHASPTITKKYIGIREDEIADSLKDFRL